MRKIYTTFFLFCLASLLQSCSAIYEDWDYSGHYKVGKPYTINNKQYHPKVVKHHDETGLASWYGPGFHGKDTANGEVFHQRRLTAAHRTLPLPSLVRVTNLKNNKSVIVRINDRGPFAKNKHNRIIDLSEKAAELLGMKEEGVAKVNIKLLPAATAKLHKKLNLVNSHYNKLELKP